jgi:hypothetical protein
LLDSMLVRALDLPSDVWLRRAPEDLDYYTNMLNVEFLFPEEYVIADVDMPRSSEDEPQEEPKGHVNIGFAKEKRRKIPAKHVDDSSPSARRMSTRYGGLGGRGRYGRKSTRGRGGRGGRNRTAAARPDKPIKEEKPDAESDREEQSPVEEANQGDSMDGGLEKSPTNDDRSANSATTPASIVAEPHDGTGVEDDEDLPLSKRAKVEVADDGEVAGSDIDDDGDADNEKENGEMSSKRKKRKSHKCVACKRHYISLSALEHHYEKACVERDPMELKYEEVKDAGYRCEVPDCEEGEEVFPTKSLFSLHWEEVHVPDDKKHLPCSVCNKSFATVGGRRTHIRKVHERSHRCEKCGRRFYTFKSLMLHMHSHAQKDGDAEVDPATSYLCLKCGQTLCKPYGKSHEKRCTGTNVRHPEYRVINNEYFCTVKGCDLNFGFNALYGLRKHFHEVHIGEDEKYFPCSYCDKKFSFKTTRNKHIKAVHEKSHVCPVCKRAFGGKDKLDGHMFTHTGEKPYVCDKCDYSSSKRYNLEMHKQSKHSEFQTKNYVCALCNKQFVTMGRVLFLRV